MSTPYWITSPKKSGCIEADNPEAASALFKELTGHDAETCKRLPYPGDPRLNKVEHLFTDGRKSICPSFCLHPRDCAGRSCCPRNYSCVE